MAHKPTTPPQSFAETLARIQAAQPPRRKVAPAPQQAAAPLDLSGVKLGNGGATKPQDFLSWLIDIGTRPLTAVTNTLKTGVEKSGKSFRDLQAGKDFGTLAGDVADTATSMATAPWRGLLSTDKKDHPLGAELAHAAMDEITAPAVGQDKYDRLKAENPELLDNFANATGIVTDFALDPLMYVPGAAFAKAGALGAKGIKTAVEALPKGEKVVAGYQGGRDAVKDGVKALLPGQGKVTNEELRQAQEATAAQEAVRPTLDQGLKLDGELPTTAPANVSRVEELYSAPEAPKVVEPEPLPELASKQVAADPKITRAHDYIQGLSKADAAEAPIPTVPLSKGEWLQQYVREYPDGTFKGVPHPNPEIGGGLISARVANIAEHPELINNPKVSGQLGQAYQRYVAGFAKAPGKKVDSLGIVSKSRKKVDATPFGRFNRATDTEEKAAQVEQQLGQHLYSYMKRAQSPATFQKNMDAVLDVLTRTDQLDVIKSEARRSAALKAVLGTTDVDVVGTNLRIMNANSNVAAVLGTQETVADVIGKSAKGAESALDAVTRATTDEVIDKGVPGMNAASKSERMAQLTEQEKRVLSYLPASLKRQFSLSKSTHPFESASGAKRTAANMGEGYGRYDRIYNGPAQQEVGIDAMKYWIDKVGEKDATGHFLSGDKRSAVIKAGWIDDMQLIEQVMEREGYQGWMGYGAKDGLVPLYQSQMLTVLDDAGGDAMMKYLYNTDTRVPWSNLMSGVLTALEGGTKADVLKWIENTELRNTKAGAMENRLTGGGTRRNGHYGVQPKVGAKRLRDNLKRKFPDATIRPNIQNGKTIGFYVTYKTDKLASDLADIIIKATPRMKAVVSENAASLQARIGTETRELSDAMLSKLTAWADDPTKVSETMIAVSNTDRMVADAAEDAGSLFDSEVKAATVVEDALEKPIVENAHGVTEATAASKRATTPGQSAGRTPKAVDKAGTDARKEKLQEGGDNAYAEQLEADPMHGEDELNMIERGSDRDRSIPADLLEDDGWDASGKTYHEVNSRIAKMMEPLAKTFKADKGFENLYQTFHSFGNGSSARASHFVRRLSAFDKLYNKALPGMETTTAKAAWDDWTRGSRGVTAEVQEAVKGIDDLMSGIIGGKSGSLNNIAFMRTPASMQAVQFRLDQTLRVGNKYNLDAYQFDMKQAMKDAEVNGTDAMTEVWDQVKGWDIADPVDFMNRLYVAAEQVATDAGVAQTLTRKMFDRGLASNTPKQGFTKIRFSEDNRYGAMLDPDVYWSKEIAEEFSVLDAVSRASTSFNGGFGTFIRDYYDKTQGAWKYAITLPRPGHHIRNMIGDMSMTFISEGFDYLRKSSKDAWKVMHLRGSYDDIDITKALEYMGVGELPGKGEVLLTARNGLPDLLVDEATDAAFNRGLFNSVNSLEDIPDTLRNPLIEPEHGYGKVIGKVFLRHGKIEKAGASLSEARDHLVRSQHFLQHIYKKMNDPKWHGTKEQLFDEAAAAVKKNHPDASMLSVPERKFFKRIFPFYSWTRGAIPAIIEGAMLHPGRAMAFPKASYELAVAMGINPSSISDPFPEDQLFPSFLTEQVLGPQFKVGGSYLGVNPGIAEVDVANMFANPVQGIAGQVSPLIRIGPELLSGSSWATGSKIKDKSDYLDATLPGINYLSNISGTSVTGSLVSAPLTGQLDPQAQVAAGNKTIADQGLSFLNYLTGLNIQNMSKPNYINYAEIEKRNAEGGPSASF